MLPSNMDTTMQVNPTPHQNNKETCEQDEESIPPLSKTNQTKNRQMLTNLWKIIK